MSRQEPGLPPDLVGLEAALAALTPAPVKLDRDALFFRAGRAAAARDNWVWRYTTVVSTLTALVLAILLVTRPVPLQPVPQYIYLHAPAPADPGTPPAPEPVLGSPLVPAPSVPE